MSAVYSELLLDDVELLCWKNTMADIVKHSYVSHARFDYLGLLVALTTGDDVFGVEIREELYDIALKTADEVRKECVAQGWTGVGRFDDIKPMCATPTIRSMH